MTTNGVPSAAWGFAVVSSRIAASAIAISPSASSASQAISAAMAPIARPTSSRAA